MSSKTPLLAAALTAALMSTAFVSGAHAETAEHSRTPFVYKSTNLVADTAGIAATTDPSLIDPWGLAFQPGGAFWINDRGAGVATLYDGTGKKVPATFTVPNVAKPNAPSSPTGLVWNSSSGFLVPGTQLTSVFLFATLEGSIAAWAPKLPVAPTVAVTAVDNSKTGAVYTALELGVSAQGTFLYAANVNSGQIDVFDTKFQPAGAKLPGHFSDPAIPAGFVPFGIHAVDGNLAVTYARQNAQKNFIVPGAGAGFVDIFDTDGTLVQRLASRGPLNAPWGVTRAPAGFGGPSGEILVGNFGDGHILSYDEDGDSIHALLDQRRQQIVIPGLWSLHFGGGAVSDPRTLFFTAGIGQGTHGLFGALTPIDPFEFVSNN
ncbi:MAG TPA: TIGR03118 family protein [Aliidongia sp.]|nr:TIGR03118 family protein [Aliidongia sp.]